MTGASLLLLAVGLGYLLLLFLLAYAVDEGWLPAALARHPLTYTLSLGTYATTWSFYGSVGFAAHEGYLFIAFFFGATLAMILAPVLLQPLLRVVREHQLGSLADLLAFRFPGRATGAVVTVLLLVGLLPYIALQIQAVVTSARVLVPEVPADILAFVFCLSISLFAVLFGARQVTPRTKHEGLVVAIAFESLIKLAALLVVAVVAVWILHREGGSLSAWLAAHPDRTEALMAPVRDADNASAWSSLLLVAFAAAFLLPRQFHMMFTENIDADGLRTASWAFPLFLLLVNLAVPPVLWASGALRLDSSPDYHTLTLMNHAGEGLGVITFVGGLSAASAMIIVESLSLGAMCLNHLLLPGWLRSRSANAAPLYQPLLWARRATIAAIIFGGYGVYLWIRDRQSLVHLGLISFTAVAQFLPGVVGMLCWSRVNRSGFLLGLCGGMFVWFLIDVLPLLTARPSPLIHLPLGDAAPWVFSTFWSLGVNLLLLMAGAFLGSNTEREAAADQALRLNADLLLTPPPGVECAADLQPAMVPLLGRLTAAAELDRALDDVSLSRDETRPRQLHFLQERLMRNLSGLVGPQLARTALALPPLQAPAPTRLIEEALEHTDSGFSGLAAELNHLRRFHRQILQSLPIGVCTFDAQQRLQMWNECLAGISGVRPDSVLGVPVSRLPSPWNDLLSGFLDGRADTQYRARLAQPGTALCLNLHRETIRDHDGDSTVVLVEDLTERTRLEAELAHADRLASIGTLASGVAHEIGNPLTGISCAAQALRAETTLPEHAEFAAEILQQTRRIDEIVRSLLRFAHADAPHSQVQAESIRIAEVIDEAIRLVRLSQAARRLTLRNEVDPELVVRGDRGRILQVFVNVLSNAADASPADGMVRITAEHRSSGLRLSVVDQGPGMPPDVLARVLEPFFTTKDPGQGTGLGLALVDRIMSDHGGRVALRSTPGSGTRVQLDFPNHEPLKGAA